MKRVYVIALIGALLVFSTSMLMKSSLTKDKIEEGTFEADASVTADKTVSSTDVKGEEKQEVTHKNKVAVKNSTSDSVAIDSVTDAVVSDVTADDVSLSSESNDTAVLSADMQNYDQLKNNSYDY